MPWRWHAVKTVRCKRGTFWTLELPNWSRVFIDVMDEHVMNSNNSNLESQNEVQKLLKRELNPVSYLWNIS